MLQSKNTCVWGNMIEFLFKPLGGLELLLELNCKAKDVHDICKQKIPAFYQSVLRAWYILQNKICNNLDYNAVSKNEIIWGNDKIRLNGKVLFFTEWIAANIIKLKDIIDKKQFISLTKLSNMVKCSRNVFYFHKVLNAIPKEWKENLRLDQLCLQKKKSRT